MQRWITTLNSNRRILSVALFATLGLVMLTSPSIAAASYSSTILSSSPNMYLRLGEASGNSAADAASGSGAFYANSPLLGQTGALTGDSNTAVRFDGIASYAYANGYNAPSGSYTLEAWVKLVSVSGSWQTIVMQGSGPKLQVHSTGFRLDHVGGAATVDASQSVTAGQWYFVAGTWNGTVAKLYVNGVLQGSANTSVNTSGGSTIYVATSGGGEFLNGTVDEVAYYSPALSAPTLTTQYQQAGAPSPPPVPVNTAAPSLTGTGAYGSTLTCNPGTWTGASGYVYAWYRDSVLLPGQTASTYVVGAADAGHSISCSVAASNNNGTASPVTVNTPITGGAVPPASPPQNTSAPFMSGNSGYGSTLTCHTGTWTAATTFTYAWYRDSTLIDGQTSSTYTVVAADAGHTISCAVGASNDNGSTPVVTSTTTVTGGPAPTPANPPVLNGPQPGGTTAVGASLVCTPGSWIGSSTFTYAWLRDGNPITGATSSSYTPTDADNGHTISCQLTVAGSNGATTVVTAGSTQITKPSGDNNNNPGNTAVAITTFTGPKKMLTAAATKKALRTATKKCSKKKGAAKKKCVAAAKAKYKKQPAFNYVVTVPGTVTLTVTATVKGKLKGKKCIASTSKKKVAKKKRCTTTVTAFTKRLPATTTPGTVTVKLSKKVKPGKYVAKLTLVAGSTVARSVNIKIS